MSYEWIKHLGQRCSTVGPQKRNVTLLNRWWYISGNYTHFIGAWVANSTCIFLNDQQEQAIIMSSLIHWSDLLFALSQAHWHTYTSANVNNLKYYSLFQTAANAGNISTWVKQKFCLHFYKPIIVIQGFLLQSQLDS